MKKQVSLLTLTAALLLGACSTYEEVPATSGDGATAVGFLADIAPREQSRADINVDFGTGLTGTWNGEDNLGVLANDFTKLLQFTYAPGQQGFYRLAHRHRRHLGVPRLLPSQRKRHRFRHDRNGSFQRPAHP